MSTVAVAGVGLMVVCSSSLAAVMLMGDKKGTPSPKYDDNSSSEEDGDEENEDENDTPTPSTPSPTTSINWSGPDNTSGSPVWEEFTSLKFTGTKLSSHNNTDLAQCKQKCIDNSACGGITTKTENKCYLYGGDAMPNPSSSWFTSYTLTRG